MGLYTKIIDLQKLNDAWKRVRTNKPAAGVDDVSYEEYDAGIRENLKQLNIELKEHRYEPLPVKQVVIYKGEKKRTISLFAMRDKAVQQSLASELLKLYDPELSKCTYAYRPGRAALQAIEHLDKEIKRTKCSWALRTDIKSFFDCIVHSKLYSILQKKIREQDTLNLIKICCEVKVLQKDGTISPVAVGVAQGSGIAPVLSNIYLMQFDTVLEEKCKVYVRYSDDILILGESKQEMEDLKKQMVLLLESLGLMLNEEKTVICPLEEGISFLGYNLSKKGKTIPSEVEKNLRERLETVWLEERDSIESRLKKCSEVLNGWEQYYRNERQIQSIQEYVTVVYMTRFKDANVLETIKQERKNFKNIYKEIGMYLAEVWETMQDYDMVLYEYEQIYELEQLDLDIKMRNVQEVCQYYKELLVQEQEEVWSNLMQMYSDMGAYNKASFILSRISKTMKKGTQIKETSIVGVNKGSELEVPVDTGFLSSFFKAFVGREDTYGKEELSQSKKRFVEQVAEPLTEEVIKAHLEGLVTVHTYVQRNNQTVKYLVIDVDIAKSVFLKETPENVLHKYLPQAAQETEKILHILDKMGLKGYLEESGFRGYHIWIFFTEWIPVRYVTMLADLIEEKREPDHHSITVEYFPNKSKLRGGFGQSIKLPLGYHIRSEKRSQFLTREFCPLQIDKTYLDEFAQFSLIAVKRIIAFHNHKETVIEEKQVDNNLEGFGELSNSVKVVLERCNLMRYLCQKAKTTGYLTHFERLSILYVFGHLGEEGKMFVHTVMELTLNYQFHVTDKFIQKLPAKPVSCIKLREQYKQITAEYGCSCNFKRTKDCYPSPVLHAIKSGDDISADVTVPTSRTLSKDKEKKVVEEINIHKKVQELASRIIEMKKQKRGIDKAIQKTETELERIYDQAGIDCLEVDMGLLVRRRKEQGYEWLIEI